MEPSAGGGRTGTDPRATIAEAAVGGQMQSVRAQRGRVHVPRESSAIEITGPIREMLAKFYLSNVGLAKPKLHAIGNVA